MLPEMPFFNRTGIVFWSCMLVCAGVSLLYKPKSALPLEGLVLNYHGKGSLVPFQRYKGFKNPTLWWAIVTIAVLYFYVRYF